MRHGQMAKRRFGSRLNEEETMSDPRHEPLEDMKFLGIERVVGKIESEDLGFDRSKAWLRIVVGR